MANSRQSKKRARQAEKRRKANHSKRSTMRTAIKGTQKAIQNKDKVLATKEFNKAQTLLDKLVIKGLIHMNKASRHKSRLSKQIKELVA